MYKDRINQIKIYEEELIFEDRKLKDLTDKYKKLTFDIDGNLTLINYYSDSSLINSTYNVEMIYTNSNLTQIKTTRLSTNTIITKNLVYDLDDNLTSIETI